MSEIPIQKNKRFFVQIEDGVLLKVDALNKETCENAIRRVYGNAEFRFIENREGIKRKSRYIKVSP